MNEVLQNALIDHYAKSSGLLTEEDLGAKMFEYWNEHISLLLKQSIELNELEWDNSTKLKEISSKHCVWDTISELYAFVGEVNGAPLHKEMEIVCLFVGYAVKNRKIVNGVKLPRPESFRLNFEYFIARQILAQRWKSQSILEDEIIDRKYIRSLIKKDVEFTPIKEGSLVVGRGKIDFLKISNEGFEKVRCIAEQPYRYEKYIDESDELLSRSYIKYLFGKISSNEYAKAWAKVLLGLGLKPTDKGIKFLASKVDQIMKPIMYDHLFAKRVISPEAVIEMEFIQHLYKVIKLVLDEKQINKEKIDDSVWDDSSVLYVYKGRTSCHSRNHEMESATAIFTGRNNQDIRLNVEHCKTCGKFYLRYSLYERYREKYGMLLGRIKMDSASINVDGDIILSEFSPLRLCGYSVNQQDGYTKTERHYIISKVIEKGVLTKNEVIRYLEHFINRNGQRSNNTLALEKWKEDLHFTMQYKLSEQAQYRLKRIKKY